MGQAKNQNVQETKSNLANLLTDIGLNKTKHNKTVKAYDSLKSDKSIDDRINHWVVIGDTANSIKSHLASQKTNLNSGLFGHYFKTYFNRVSDNERGAAMWLASNIDTVRPINAKLSIPGSNPEVIRRNVRKHLTKTTKDMKSDKVKKEFKEHGLTPPKSPTTPTPTIDKKQKLGESMINLEKVDSAPTSAVINWLEGLSKELKNRSNGKNVAAEFGGDSVALIEKISLELADIQERVVSKMKNTNKAKSASK